MKKMIAVICAVMLSIPWRVSAEAPQIEERTFQGVSEPGNVPQGGAKAGAPVPGSADSADVTPVLTGLHTDRYCLMEPVSRRILAESRMRERVKPSGPTRLVTAMVAYDTLDVKLPVTMLQEVRSMTEGMKQSGFLPGDSFVLSDLIRGLMLPSGNDVAVLVATVVERRASNNPGLSPEEAVKRFAGRMNEKVKSFGLTDTNFVNPTGADDPKQYSTPYDMARIGAEIANYPELQTIVAEKKHTIEATGDTGLMTHHYDLVSDNDFLSDRTSGYEFAAGIQSGAIGSDDYCILASAKKDNTRVIAAVYGEKKSEERTADAVRLCDYGLQAGAEKNILEPETAVETIRPVNVRRGDETALPVYPEKVMTAPMTPAEIGNLRRDVRLSPEVFTRKDDGWHLIRDLAAGESVGTVTVSYAGRKVGEETITVHKAMEKQTVFRNFRYFAYDEHPAVALIGGPVLIVILLYAVLWYRRIKRYRRILKKRQERPKKPSDRT